MRLTLDHLDGPAEAGARLLVTALLGEAERELARLESSEDEEALHDFRVSLRRLRSVIGALRPLLGGRIRRRHERRLRAVGQATASARDAEVHLSWLRDERTRTGAGDLPGLEWLARRLETGLDLRGDRKLRDTVASFRSLARRLQGRLGAPDDAASAAPAPAFGACLAGLVRSHGKGLMEALHAVRGPFDVEQGHAARIAAKRLRYLVEPLRGSSRADASPAVAALKDLQDLLGELHDAHVAAAAIADALVEAAIERARQAHSALVAGAPGPRALRLARGERITRGLVELDRRAVARATTSHASLVRDWPPARRAALENAVAAIAESLASPPVRARRRPRAGPPAAPSRG